MCHLNGSKCILGARGAFVKNEDRECAFHGDFDVWVTTKSLLVTDLGFPSEEPIRCIALRVNESVATELASEKSKQMRLPLETSKLKCAQCGALYWSSQHVRAPGLIQNVYANFCPECFSHTDPSEMERRLERQRRWCG